MAIISAGYGLSVDPAIGVVYGRSGRVVGRPNSRGYIQVDVRGRGPRVGVGAPFAHRVIWEAVHGPIPEGLEINHINGVKSDNRISNLELTTRAGNVQHAYRTGLKSNAGEKHPSHRLTAAIVAEIRRRYTPGHPVNSGRALAREFGVSQGAVAAVTQRRNWR